MGEAISLRGARGWGGITCRSMTINNCPFGNIISCNVHALKYTQLTHFKKAFESYNIVSLQETHGKKCKFNSTIKRLGFKEGVFSLIDKQARGTAVCWKQGKLLAKTQDTEGRIVGVALEIDSQKLIIFSVYAPNVDGTHKSWEEYTNFLVSLEMHIDKLSNEINTNYIIVNGDFNIILNSDIDSHSNNPKVYKIPKDALIEMTDRLSLSDAFRVLNGDIKTYTFDIRTRGTKC